MAKAPKNLLLGLEFPLKGWDTGWARQKQPPLTSPDLLNCLPFDLDRRARGAKRPGFSVLTGGSIGTVDFTYREAHLCETDVFAGFFVPTTEISSYPYTFSYAGVCYYVIEADPTTTEPTGAIPPAGSRTSYDDCEACDEVITPSPPAATYKRLRRCDDNSLSSLWIAAAGLVYPTHYLRTADDNCYKVLEADPTSTTPGTLVGANVEYGDCEDCDAARGAGGADNYYQAKLCSDDSYVDCWLHEDDLGADPTPINNLPIYFFRTDFSDEAVYILAAEPDSTFPGRVYDRTTETTVATSCNTLGGCFEDTMPATATVTFTGVTMQPACVGEGTDSWKTTGAINGTWTLDFVSQSSTRVVYEGPLDGGTDPRLLEFFCDIGGTNATCVTSDIPGVCTGADSNERAGWVVRLEIDTALASAGSATGWRITIDEGNPAAGPRGFRGTLETVSSCRGSKTIGSDITTRSHPNTGNTSEDTAIASGGSAVVTLGF